jgi:hypothetical protein
MPSRLGSAAAFRPSAPTWWWSWPAPVVPVPPTKAQLGWLLIPEQQAVEVWCAGGGASCEPQRLEAASELDAGPLFPGLRLDLQEIWQV